MYNTLCLTQFVNAGLHVVDWGVPDALFQNNVFDIPRNFLSSKLNEGTCLVEVWIHEEFDVLIRDDLFVIECLAWVSDHYPRARSAVRGVG